MILFFCWKLTMRTIWSSVQRRERHMLRKELRAIVLRPNLLGICSLGSSA
ncbi:hypothetical protein GTCCBUS3UF5_7360 [Geobacillus thermoleovorans CCB_US3_UF5]|uniref:Uncharacterized protein n=1 Tax=Geobacillus thermoleovorans CCB_US3_UF5 TaxID=1111068 RepID=A0ABM5MEC8_GEOTH|nr:hypothetical protein GTCCBUS3UF5_7360 [Geobacillus thermoleovorans CCB_US3_UF5]GAJ60045.1 hypothetical protein B23_3271 [Geobacillus thermoleovorans B23]